MDTLFYLSQCESVDDINLDMFVLSLNIPKTISNFENKLLKKVEKDERFDEVDETPIELDTDGFQVEREYPAIDPTTINVPQRAELDIGWTVNTHTQINTRYVVGNEYNAGDPEVTIGDVIIPDDVTINSRENLPISDHDRELLNQIVTSLEQRHQTETVEIRLDESILDLPVPQIGLIQLATIEAVPITINITRDNGEQTNDTNRESTVAS